MWKLNEPNFSFFDRLKFSAWVLSGKNFWTMNGQVARFEKRMAEFVGSKFAVFTSSGSTANTILAMYLKDKFFSESKKEIIFPSTTWTTSVSPFLREGFTPRFIDISFKDFSIDLDKLDSYLKNNDRSVCCVFITSLIGFTPDIYKIKKIAERYNVLILMDNCENTLGSFDGKNVSSFFTSTTSTYFGHQIQSVEGGFLFTDSEEEYDYFLMARNHGMCRASINPQKHNNSDVDPQFDFNFLGNNYRNSDIHAFLGNLDLDRASSLTKIRSDLYNVFLKNLKNKAFLPIPNHVFGHVPFCLPIFCKNIEKKQKAINFCKINQIEQRPIISGNLLRQTCYKKYGDYSDFQNSEFLHQNAFYVGLHKNVKLKNVIKLVDFLNKEDI